MKTEDKEEIAKNIYGVPNEYLESWLRNLTYVRNVCAHYARIYNKNIVIRPKLHKRDLRRLGNDKIFAPIFIMKKMALDNEQWRNFVTRLEALVDQYNDVLELGELGFPLGWNSLLREA